MSRDIVSDTLPPDLRTLLDQIAVRLARMDTRLDHIEADIGEIKADAKAAGQEIVSIRVELATLTARVAGLPTIWQMFSIVFGVLIGLPVVSAIGIFVLKTAGYLP